MDSPRETARDILHNHSLVINGSHHKLTEIELYLYSSSHQDEYVHKTLEQMDYGRVYFHKHKNGTYKGGTYKGMDLVFGSEDVYFGILVRGLMRQDTKKVGLVCV